MSLSLIHSQRYSAYPSAAQMSLAEEGDEGPSVEPHAFAAVGRKDDEDSESDNGIGGTLDVMA